MTTDTIKITMDLLYRKYLIPMLLLMKTDISSIQKI